jgi:hypothetical protein
MKFYVLKEQQKALSWFLACRHVFHAFADFRHVQAVRIFSVKPKDGRVQLQQCVFQVAGF